MASINFLNAKTGEEESLVTSGRNHMLSRAEDIEFYLNFDGCENKDDFRERIEYMDLDFGEMRNAYKMFIDIGTVSLCEYGLCFGFVDADEESDGYYRFQISWGGPSEEVRFYHNGSIEFVYLDWYVGVGFNVNFHPTFGRLLEWFQDLQAINWDSLEPEQIEFDEEYI